MSQLTERVARDLHEIADRAAVTPEAIESIRQRIATEGDGPTIIDDLRSRPRRRPATWLVAAAAVVILVVGVFVVTRDSEEGGIETITPPEEEPVPTPPTVSTSTTPTVPVDQWAFDITYVEVDAGHAVAANEEFAWVAGTNESVLSTIDLETNEVVAVTEIAEGAGNANFGFGSVWIRHSDGWITRFDPEINEAVARIEVGGTNLGWIEPGMESIWLGGGDNGEVVRIDPETNTITARIPLLGRIGGVGENESGVWATNGDRLVFGIDPGTEQVVPVSVPQTRGLMVSPEAAWTPGGDTGLVFRIDPATNDVGAEIDLSAYFGYPVDARGVHYTGGTVWVRYLHDCVEGSCKEGVVRIDPDTNEIVAAVELRESWSEGSGVSAGPTTAWVWGDDVIARLDFVLPDASSD